MAELIIGANKQETHIIEYMKNNKNIIFTLSKDYCDNMDVNHYSLNFNNLDTWKFLSKNLPKLSKIIFDWSVIKFATILDSCWVNILKIIYDMLDKNGIFIIDNSHITFGVRGISYSSNINNDKQIMNNELINFCIEQKAIDVNLNVVSYFKTKYLTDIIFHREFDLYDYDIYLHGDETYNNISLNDKYTFLQLFEKYSDNKHYNIIIHCLNELFDKKHFNKITNINNFSIFNKNKIYFYNIFKIIYNFDIFNFNKIDVYNFINFIITIIADVVKQQICLWNEQYFRVLGCSDVKIISNHPINIEKNFDGFIITK